MMRAKDHRRSIPMGVKLHACLLLLGFTDEQIEEGVEFDHDPALGIRALDENGNLHPAANDPHYLRPLTKPAHATKTRGSGATTAGSDVGRAAKLKRLEAAREAYRQVILRKMDSGDTPDAPGTRKPKRAWPKGRKIENRKKKT